MDPRFARNRLSAYLDDELPPGERSAVKAALDQDDGLREELARLRAVRALLREEADEVAPAGFTADLRARIAEERPPGVWERMRAAMPRWFRLEAALVVTAAAGVFVLLGRADPPPPAPAPVATAPAPLLPDPPADPSTVAPELADLDGVQFSEKPPGTAPSLAVGAGGNSGRSGAARAPAPRPPGRSPGVVDAKGEEREPYTPEWERTSGTVLTGALVDYRLVSADEKALFRLEAMVKSLGGRLLTREGKPIAPYHLDPAEARALQVELPGYKLGELRTRLGELGALEATPRANPQLGSENTPVSVTLQVAREE